MCTPYMPVLFIFQSKALPSLAGLHLSKLSFRQQTQDMKSQPTWC